MGSSVFSKPTPQAEAYRTTDKSFALWKCSNPLSLTCGHHGDEIHVPCGRWRTCPGCGRRLQWRLRQRFLAGMAETPDPLRAMFFTATFPLDQAPDEDGAHRSLRSLVRRLRYRGKLGAYGWVLQRQANGTLHYHGIAHMPWFDDGLAEWRRLLVASGFGVQNKLVVARPEHAAYCARYISARLATLAPLRRAYSFSRDFPRSAWELERRARKAAEREFCEEFGAEPLCQWMPTGTARGLLR